MGGGEGSVRSVSASVLRNQCFEGSAVTLMGRAELGP